MYPELNGAVHFFCFRSEKPFWQNLVQTVKIWYLAEFGTYNNSNIQNSVVMLTFCVSDRKYLHRARSLVVSDLRVRLLQPGPKQCFKITIYSVSVQARFSASKTKIDI